MKRRILVIAFLILITAVAFADGIEITSISNGGDQGIHVVWTDPENSGPYKVLYQPVFEGNETAPSENNIIWCNSGDITECEYSELYTVPDADYWIIVCDNAGHQAVGRYKAVHKNMYDLQLLIKPQILRVSNGSREYEDTNGDRYRDYMVSQQISAEDVLSLPENEIYGLRLKISSNQPDTDGEYMLRYGISSIKFLKEGKDSIPDMPMVIGAMTDRSMPIVLTPEHREAELFIPLSDFIGNYMPDPGSYILSIYAGDTCLSTFRLRIS